MIPCPDVTGLAGLHATYGNPLDYLDDKAAWEVKVLVTRPLPFADGLVYAYDRTRTVRQVRAHHLVIDTLIDALTACRDAGVPSSRLAYGGCYVWRAMRGTSRLRLSTHTWGIAVDLEPAANPIGRVWRDDGRMLDPRVVAIFEARGWRWGGRFRRQDAMHFQAVKGY